jgi:predicted pyridoxine 5'-phosphate oxidase superfamily flavin-nucleotide-binding protein
MADKYIQLVLTPAVQRAQDKYFGKHQVVENAPETDALTPDEIGFIASRDSFYLATVSETGWPYVQHRGGPPGFVKVLGPNLMGLADFKGNCQLASTGNLAVTDRVTLFMMDYPRRTRLKLLGLARVRRARASRADRSTRPRIASQQGGAVVPHPGHFLRLETTCKTACNTSPRASPPPRSKSMRRWKPNSLHAPPKGLGSIDDIEVQAIPT